MSVLLETSLGDLVVDLHTELAPRSCTNFLKLCQKHYYKLNAFFSVEKDFLAQTGDPSNTGKGGASIWSQLPSTSRDRSANTYFTPETSDDQLRHTQKGTVSFACFRKQVGDAEARDELVAGSQFFITLKDEIDYLDGKHAPFGMVVEGQEPGGTLDKINQAFTDDEKRPLKDIRIRHVVVLEDPFPDPSGFDAPSRSPSPTPSQIRALRLADDEDLTLADPDSAADEEVRRKKDTDAAALTLEMVGDLPFAEIRPPENILFVCKLNPVTRSDDLELIFSRFGKILSCEVVKDRKTGDSLQYAFIEFDRKEDAERAYFKMQNVLVDDRRIWVDFSQSVRKLHGDWVRKRTGGRQEKEGRGMDSYRPKEREGERRGSSRPDGARQRDNGRAYRSRDDEQEREYKRSRRDYDDEPRHSRGPHLPSSRSDRQGPRREHERDDRRRDDRSMSKAERREDRHAHRRRDEDDRYHRSSASQRDDEGRSQRSHRERDDRRDRDRERDHRRRDDDRPRYRDDERR